LYTVTTASRAVGVGCGTAGRAVGISWLQ